MGQAERAGTRVVNDAEVWTANEMLERIINSLKSTRWDRETQQLITDHGGDVSIMTEVERIARGTYCDGLMAG